MQRLGDSARPLPCLLLLFALASPARATATSSQTFILSNEGGGLISQLNAAGYGNLNSYSALTFLDQESNPTVVGIITPAFLNALRNCPASSAIFTMQLKSFDPAKGTGLAISDDCTVQYTDVTGFEFHNQGTPTEDSMISGMGRALFTHSASGSLTSWQAGGGVTATYNAFAVGWMSGTAPPSTPAPPMLWLAIIGSAALLGSALWSRRRRHV